MVLFRKQPCYNMFVMNHHKIFLIIATIGLSGFFLAAFSGLYCDAACKVEEMREDTPSFTHISPEQFHKQSKSAQMIDVRTPEEYVEGHIPGAALIDIYADDFKQRIGQLDRDEPYYIYCRSGSRSRSATGIMKKAGFSHVYGLDGGMIAWRAAELPVE